MKKILLTEEQLQKVESQVIKESNDYRFEETVKFDVDYYGVTFKGEEIDWVDDVSFDINFRIDMEYRRYGIKSISVYAFNGPDSVELEITPRVDDADSETITLPLRWSEDGFVQTEEREDMGWIGVDNDATLKLGNDENGNIYVEFVSFNIKDI